MDLTSSSSFRLELYKFWLGNDYFKLYLLYFIYFNLFKSYTIVICGRNVIVNFRNSARRYSHKQVQSHQRPSDPYPHNTKSSGTQSGMGTYRLVVKRRGSTPSPNRLNPGVSSTSLLSNDVYEDFHTNSLGRGQSKNVCKDHFNDLALHRSISPLLSRC